MWYKLFCVLGVAVLLFSCAPNSSEAWNTEIRNCWQVDSLYFGVEVDEKWQPQLKKLEAKAQESSCFEFLENGRCRFLIEGQQLEGLWTIQDAFLKVKLENGSENQFRILNLDSTQLLLAFPIVLGAGEELELFQQMSPARQSFQEYLAKVGERACVDDPWAATLRTKSPLGWTYFNFSKARTCAQQQNKPLLHCYLNGEDANSNEVVYQILALPRLQKFMHREFVVAIHFVDMPTDLAGAAPQLQAQSDSLLKWSVQPPFFVVRDPNSNQLVDSLSSPKDDIAFKRFLVEALDEI